MPEHEEKTCPRCSRSFQCKVGNIGACQCAGVKLTPEQRQYLIERWADCLCTPCLLDENGDGEFTGVTDRTERRPGQ